MTTSTTRKWTAAPNATTTPVAAAAAAGPLSDTAATASAAANLSSDSVGPNRYVYCICDWDERVNLGPLGVGEPPPEVFTLPHQGLAALVSQTGLGKYEISRKNLLAHQKLMEAAMAAGRTVLPVKFNTIAERRTNKEAEQDIVDRVLTGRKAELTDLMDFFRDRVELGVKGLWSDMKAVFAGIVRDHPDIAALREKVAAAASAVRRRGGEVALQMKLGERVKQALDARKVAAQQELIARLSAAVCDVRRNATFGDPMFANLSLLVEKKNLADFEAILSAFEQAHAPGVALRYVGPLPPSSFLQLVIDWED